MTTKELAGTTVDVDAEGFLTDHTVWNLDLAAAIAIEEGIDPLTDRHVEVLNFMRKEFEENGTAPSIRKMNKLNIVPTKELYALFPGGPAKKAAKIAGLGKPQGCI
ncbi:MAG: TusE/DsrC/DsvC family sulfur relay protein [Candidatus Marinimicrobia bacterium]|jgi:dissimilatory sulfite reductase related protein|nr:TusE/DsrC/DsvC family sulfur relay protein [Candidatus Neomarinimicrobiota bacterium]MBT4362684.1 TusE/DsrC/DsvC family sulfur relay protein [Candidatus Neomarinimicrobiota bacterium]MBT4713306.1 TusE/DsrC/DsvC family sulfur relay protein [Candidatus Neomarinimicrobiota bacterium]MBT4944827.1 TusE/DsrC/DsvC family sulfur relay protein [Candidatus Neomarinimicrobiota bacterium]MBT5271663.1 TusE/DsrC/DsvC family sulfur relay protein [Candidatus Neomarinimicrobiota bacterium]